MLASLIDWSARNRALVLLTSLFVSLAGAWVLWRTPVDALPDLSDVQVVVVTDYPGQAPQIVEDQVTYPLTSALLGVPGSRAVRAMSYFGVSFVYVVFEEGTDIYWARSRVLESLGRVGADLPASVTPRRRAVPTAGCLARSAVGAIGGAFLLWQKYTKDTAAAIAGLTKATVADTVWVASFSQ